MDQTDAMGLLQGPGDRLLILDGSGNQIPFKPGTTWIQLTRPGANVQID